MAPPCSSIQFIDTALSCTSPFALSYTDLNQKWLIRKHLISLVQNYPDFTLSTDPYYHNDGSTVNLLNASGYLRVSNITPPVHVTIWLHENYPHMPPIVFINTSSNTLNQIHQNHPFVDLCGLTTSPYLQTWLHPGCNLCNLVHNLIKIFSHDHPFSVSSTTTSFTHPSLVSKREALDRLLGMLHYDKAALQAKAEEDIEGLSILQVELEKRAGVIKNIITELEHESLKLKERVMELAEETDVVMNWLKVNDLKSFGVIAGEEMENAFEGVDEESKMVINGLAADTGIEDVIYELDKALEQGVVSFDIYIKQVRNLARDQFPYRYLLVKLKGPDILFN